jgi:hypothetical protein
MTSSFIQNFQFEINLAQYKAVEVKLVDKVYALVIDNVRWLIYNPLTKIEAHQCLSHYDLATGTVITTGLGLGLREQLLLSNPKVTKLIVIEKSKDLIDYHLKTSNWVNNSKLTIINQPVHKYMGDCDVLLLDHYEQQNFTAILNDVANISKKIESKLMWFWPFEDYIIKNSIDKNITLSESYVDLKTRYNFKLFPDLTESQLLTYCSSFQSVR